jgi:hypothetical protein
LLEEAFGSDPRYTTARRDPFAYKLRPSGSAPDGNRIRLAGTRKAPAPMRFASSSSNVLATASIKSGAVERILWKRWGIDRSLSAVGPHRTSRIPQSHTTVRESELISRGAIACIQG